MKIFTSILSLPPRIKPSKFTSGSSWVLINSTSVDTSLKADLQSADPENGPDLVIGADTVVLTHAQPISSDVAYSELPSMRQELLEKPENKADNLRMLQDLNGSVCEVVTGVSIGEQSWAFLYACSDVDLPLSPSYSIPCTDITWIQHTVGYFFR